MYCDCAIVSCIAALAFMYIVHINFLNVGKQVQLHIISSKMGSKAHQNNCNVQRHLVWREKSLLTLRGTFFRDAGSRPAFHHWYYICQIMESWMGPSMNALLEGNAEVPDWQVPKTGISSILQHKSVSIALMTYHSQ